MSKLDAASAAISNGVAALYGMPIRSANVDFTSGWNKFISLVESSTGSLLTIAAALGVALIVIFSLLWGYKKRRNQGEKFPWVIVLVGAALASPKAIVPFILNVFEFILNFFLSLGGGVV